MKGNHFSRFGASPVDTTNSNNNNNVRSSSPGAHSSLDDSMSQQGGGGAGGLMMMGDNSDYRDTVMYLAQQQNMNHQEMMSMLRQVLGALASSSVSSNLAAASGGGKGGAAPLQQQYAYSPTGPLGAVVAAGDQQQPYVPELEYRLKKVTDYAQTVENPAVVKELVLPATSGAYLATQQGWYQGVNALELELTAAKTRIQQLEQRNKLLQEQLQQKEQTIQRLTEMNVANVSRRIGGGSSAGGASPAVGGFITPSRQQHAEAVGELSSGLAVSGSPALRELLKKHQASCSQLLA